MHLVLQRYAPLWPQISVAPLSAHGCHISLRQRSYKATTSRSSSSSSSPSSAMQHYDLSSFLAYARRTGLSPTSTFFVGTQFEYATLSALSRLGFSLTRTGGTADNGIDLLGTWRVPDAHQPIRVLVQCKALNRKPGPSTVRELEGTFGAAPAAWRAGLNVSDNLEIEAAAAAGETLDAESSSVDRSIDLAAEDDGGGSGGSAVMAILAATKEATPGVIQALGRSRLPMGFIKLSLQSRPGTPAPTVKAGEPAPAPAEPEVRVGSPDDTAAAEAGVPSGDASVEARVEQFLWNKAAAAAGLQGLSVSLRYRADGTSEVCLLHRGSLVWPDPA